MNIVVWLTLGLILARLAAELWLAALNRRHVLAHAGEIPPAFRGIIDEPAYKKSVAYTLAKGRLGNIEDAWSTVGPAGRFIQRRSAVGVSAFLARAGPVGVGDGGVSVCGGLGAVAARFAVRLVRAVPAGGTIRVQHHDAENLVDRTG